MSTHWTDEQPEPDPNETPTWMIVVLILGMGYVVGQVIRSML